MMAVNMPAPGRSTHTTPPNPTSNAATTRGATRRPNHTRSMMGRNSGKAWKTTVASARRARPSVVKKHAMPARPARLRTRWPPRCCVRNARGPARTAHGTSTTSANAFLKNTLMVVGRSCDATFTAAPMTANDRADATMNMAARRRSSSGATWMGSARSRAGVAPTRLRGRPPTPATPIGPARRARGRLDRRIDQPERQLLLDGAHGPDSRRGSPASPPRRPHRHAPCARPGARRCRHRVAALVVDDARDLVDVEPARRDVGGDQDPHASALERLHRVGSPILRPVGVDGRAPDARRRQPPASWSAWRFIRTKIRLVPCQRRRCVLSQSTFSSSRIRCTSCVMADVRPVVPPTRTSTGSRMISAADRITSGEVVAEKNSVCRVGGQRRHDLLHVGPEAHVEHAIGLVEHQRRKPVEVEAAVAHVVDEPSRRGDHDIDTRLERARLRAHVDAAVIDVPDNPAWDEKPRKSSSIWCASSRVGARISTFIVPGSGASWWSSSRCINGSRKAAVLPVPVCAHAMTSRPSSTMSNTARWTGVGWTNPRSARPLRMPRASPSSSKVVGVSSTGISSKTSRPGTAVAVVVGAVDAPPEGARRRRGVGVWERQ